MPAEPGADLDPIRVEQGVVGVTLLVAFVYGTSWAVPAWTVLLGAGAAFGPRAHAVALGYAALARRRSGGRRAGGTDTPVDPAASTITTLAETVALAAATLLFFVGIGGLAWLIALAVAVAGVVTAVTGTFPVHEVWRRFGRGRRRG